MFGTGAPIWQFKKALRADDDPERARNSDHGLFLVEVFPALALPGLHVPFARRLGAPKYNPKNRKFQLSDWAPVVKAIVGVAEGLGLTACAEWCSEVSAEAKPTRCPRLPRLCDLRPDRIYLGRMPPVRVHVARRCRKRLYRHSRVRGNRGQANHFRDGQGRASQLAGSLDRPFVGELLT